MADISKCEGKGCPIKDKCYRFTAKANDFYQAWIYQLEGETDGSQGEDCAMFMEVKDEHRD